VPRSCIVDSGALAALLDPREEHHRWAREVFFRQPLPWLTCEAVASETFFLLHEPHARALEKLLRQGHLRMGLNLADELIHVLDLRAKYADVPMSLADACLVRMSETLPDPVVLTTDADFKIYRRHSRQVVPCLMPGP
jgi:predicted nucleic acid-binding protein